jgi:hypothetical protein
MLAIANSLLVISLVLTIPVKFVRGDPASLHLRPDQRDFLTTG